MLDGKEREGRERHETEEVMEPQSRDVLCALGAGWGELRESWALELGSLGRVGSQEGIWSSAFGSQTPSTSERWNGWPHFAPLSSFTRPPLPHSGKSIFHAP